MAIAGPSTEGLGRPGAAGPSTAGWYVALALMVASGFAGLGYQIIWTQQSALWLGHESASVLAVLSAFFGGIALGAWFLAPRVEASRRPARWYAACEVLTGGWALLLSALAAPVSAGLLGLIGTQPSPSWHWTAAFGGSLLLLLPATVAMGATLPAMERVLSALRPQRAGIASLYAANTLGAVLGVLATAFWLVPRFGLTRSAAACALLNFLCAAAALRLEGQPPPVPARAKDESALGLYVLFAFTGLLGIGYEVLVVRVLSQVAENTVYTFALLLAVYLVGTALGAAAYDRWLLRAAAPRRLEQRLSQAVAAACLLGMLALGRAQAGMVGAADWLGGGMGGALGAEAALAAAAFLLPAAAMGALFSHLALGARVRGVSLGRALGANTLGACAAPALFGVMLVPGIGARLALLWVVAGYLGISRPRARSLSTWAVGFLFAGVLYLGPSLSIVDVPEGGRVVSLQEGVMAAVSVVEDAQGVARLRIDNRQQEGSSATLFADARQALLPLLLHPAPRRALFLGLGTSVTAASAAEDRALQVTAVELLPEVIEASASFRERFDRDGNGARLRILNADARRFVRTTPEHYDLIVSDNFHPARSGSGSLYTVEHFRAVGERLAVGGIFCQWLPLHQLDLYTLRSITRSFLAVYPGAWAMLATNSLETPVVGLVGRVGTHGFALPELRSRLASAAVPGPAAAFGIDDDLALLGSFIAGPGSLAKFSAGAPLNTDDHPVVAYQAPRITYAPDSRPRDRLAALLREVTISPEDLLVPPSEAAWSARLAAYWRARGQFLEAGRDVRPTGDVRGMLGQVREPLLAVLRTSPDFHPAFDPLLQMAVALSGVDPQAARALLNELRGLVPDRPELAPALGALPPLTR